MLPVSVLPPVRSTPPTVSASCDQLTPNDVIVMVAFGATFTVIVAFVLWL